MWTLERSGSSKENRMTIQELSKKWNLMNDEATARHETIDPGKRAWVSGVAYGIMAVAQMQVGYRRMIDLLEKVELEDLL